MEKRFGIVSDLHLGLRRYDTLIQLQEEDACGYGYGRIYVVIKALKKWIEKTKIKNLIVLGDIFHRKNYTTIPEVFMAKDLLNKMVAEFPGLQVLLVEGNHDICNGFPILKLLVNNQIKYFGLHTKKDRDEDIDLPFNLQVKEYKGIPYAENSYFFIIPYTDNPFVAELLLKPKKNKIILTHLQFNGVEMGSGKKLEGLSYQDCENVIISGHIHLAQTLGYKNDPQVIYIGSFSHNDFGDSGNFMGGLVIEYDAFDKLVYMEIVENDYGIEYIVDKDRPAKAKIVLYKLPVEDKGWALHHNVAHKVIFVSSLKEQSFEKVEVKPLGNIEEDFKEYINSIVKDKNKAKKLLKIGLNAIQEVIKEYGT